MDYKTFKALMEDFVRPVSKTTNHSFGKFKQHETPGNKKFEVHHVGEVDGMEVQHSTTVTAYNREAAHHHAKSEMKRKHPKVENIRVDHIQLKEEALNEDWAKTEKLIQSKRQQLSKLNNDNDPTGEKRKRISLRIRELEQSLREDVAILSEKDLCETCHESDDVRPYGKDGALICFDCAGMTMDEQMLMLFGEEVETLDEVSKQTLANYITKELPDARKHTKDEDMINEEHYVSHWKDHDGKVGAKHFSMKTKYTHHDVEALSAQHASHHSHDDHITHGPFRTAKAAREHAKNIVAQQRRPTQT